MSGLTSSQPLISGTAVSSWQTFHECPGYYSVRSATIGSMRVARPAGSDDTGTYAGYRQMLHISPSGDLSAEGRPEPMTIGGTVIIYESPSGRELYLVSGFPSLSLLAVPIGKAPVSLLPEHRLNPNYVLRQQSYVGGSSTVGDAGLLSVEKEAEGYHIMLYREDKEGPEEIPHSQIDEPIDSIAWDPIEKAVLLSTISTSIGTLLALSK